MARRWLDAGARRLHLVDLNGAFAGKPVNEGAVKSILAEVGGEIPVQLGGGIRDLDTIERYLDDGLSYIIIGTAAVKNPGFLRDACSAFGGHIIVGLDAQGRQGRDRRLEQAHRPRGGRSGAQVPGLRGRRTHLHRHRSRRHALGRERRRDRQAGAGPDDPGHRLRRRRLDGRHRAAVRGAGSRHRRASSAVARSTPATSISQPPRRAPTSWPTPEPAGLHGLLRSSRRRRHRRHSTDAREKNHSLPRRDRRPRRQGRELRRPARRRRPGRDRRALQRAGRRRADLPRHHGHQRRPRPDPAHRRGGRRRGLHPAHRRWRRAHASPTCGACSTPAPTRSASTRRRCPIRSVIRDASAKYGAQCIVVAIDAKRRDGAPGWEVYTHGGRRNTGTRRRRSGRGGWPSRAPARSCSPAWTATAPGAASTSG